MKYEVKPKPIQIKNNEIVEEPKLIVRIRQDMYKQKNGSYVIKHTITPLKRGSNNSSIVTDYLDICLDDYKSELIDLINLPKNISNDEKYCVVINTQQVCDFNGCDDELQSIDFYKVEKKGGSK